MIGKTAVNPPFQVGMLLIPPFQLLDASPIDLFGMMTPDYLKACNLPAPLIALGVDVVTHYIGESGAGTIAEGTAGCGLRLTKSLSDTEVQPGRLDVLLIPGPDPNDVPSENVKKFIKAHMDNGHADILTVCTGIFPAGYSGILGGKTVTGPRALLGELRKKFPDATWADKRWHRDGKLWTSGGITNGQDLVAAYLRDTFKREVVDLVCAMADVGARGQAYDNGKIAENSWWIWLIFRSWWNGKKE